MKLFGYNIEFKRLKEIPGRLQNVIGTWSRIIETVTGAWQADGSVRTLPDEPLLSSPVYACMRIIASDVAKLPLVVKRKVSKLWEEVDNSPFSTVLRKPNFWQTRVEFFMHWLLTLLHYGNTYVLLDKDDRGVVRRMTVLDPQKVQVLVAETTGDIFYKVSLGSNPLAGLYRMEDVYIPAEYILHHKYMPIEHPLIGCPPLRVAALSANTGRKVIAAHSELFTNGIIPPGILVLPEGATQEQIETLSTQWAEFRRTGRTAVVEASTKFEAISQKSIDSQALELLKWSYVDVCIAFGVPAWKIGAEALPAGATAETSNLLYLSQTLQIILEEIEALLDDKLALPANVSAEFDTNALYRMDTLTRYKAASEGVKGGWLTPNEGRAKADNLPPVPGGDTPYMQQQNFSLAALDKRDTAPQALATGSTTGNPPSDNPTDDAEDDAADEDNSEGKQDETLRAAIGAPYKGVHTDSATYVAGNMVTRSGSLWAALDGFSTYGIPGNPDSGWKLIVKRGSLK